MEVFYPGVFVSDKADGFKSGDPSLELVHPVVQGGLGHQHHVGARNVAIVFQVSQQGYGLQSLPQTLLTTTTY